MYAQDTDLKDAIIRALDDLPTQQVAEVLDFVLFLKQRKQAGGQDQPRRPVKAVPASQLRPLVGLISVGGDAVLDSERVYSDE